MAKFSVHCTEAEALTLPSVQDKSVSMAGFMHRHQSAKHMASCLCAVGRPSTCNLGPSTLLLGI